jgi:hypothetical protein
VFTNFPFGVFPTERCSRYLQLEFKLYRVQGSGDTGRGAASEQDCHLVEVWFVTVPRRYNPITTVSHSLQNNDMHVVGYLALCGALKSNTTVRVLE